MLRERQIACTPQTDQCTPGFHASRRPLPASPPRARMRMPGGYRANPMPLDRAAAAVPLRWKAPIRNVRCSVPDRIHPPLRPPLAPAVEPAGPGPDKLSARAVGFITCPTRMTAHPETASAVSIYCGSWQLLNFSRCAARVTLISSIMHRRHEKIESKERRLK